MDDPVSVSDVLGTKVTQVSILLYSLKKNAGFFRHIYAELYIDAEWYILSTAFMANGNL